MPIRLRLSWLPRLLFQFTQAVSVLLLALVFLAPVLDNRFLPPGPWSRLLALFAYDAAVRHTSVAAALGLLVTAWVFFRPPRLLLRPPVRRGSRGKPPPPDVAGA
jgi:hypothetical protein